MSDFISRETLLDFIQKRQISNGWSQKVIDIEVLAKAINSGDLAPDLLPDSPYKQGDMICVRKGSLLLWFEREFVAMHKNQKWVWCLDDKEHHKALLWEQHKPIPKTMSVNLPVELVDEFKRVSEYFQEMSPIKKLLKLIADQVD